MQKIGSIALHRIQEIADKLDTHPETVRLYIRQGKLEATKFGKNYWITDEALKKYFYGEMVKTNES
mgnify:CR=1 FL=1